MKHSTAEALSRINKRDKNARPLKHFISLLAIDTHTFENTLEIGNNVGAPQSLQPPKLTEFLRTQVSDTYWLI